MLARPRKENQKNYDSLVQIRMTHDEKMKLDMYAKNNCMNKSDLIRIVLKSYYESEENKKTEYEDYYDDYDYDEEYDSEYN